MLVTSKIYHFSRYFSWWRLSPSFIWLWNDFQAMVSMLDNIAWLYEPG